MDKTDERNEQGEAAKGEVITRRAAIKRIAAAFAGAGIVAVGAGLIGREKVASAAYFNEGYDAYASWSYSSNS